MLITVFKVNTRKIFLKRTVMSDSRRIVAGIGEAIMETIVTWGWILAAVAAASVLHILISSFRDYRVREKGEKSHWDDFEIQC